MRVLRKLSRICLPRRLFGWRLGWVFGTVGSMVRRYLGTFLRDAIVLGFGNWCFRLEDLRLDQ